MSHYDEMVEKDAELDRKEAAMKLAAEKLAEQATKEQFIEQVLKERGDNYGDFGNLSILSQSLKNAIMQHYFATHGGDQAKPMPAYMAEGIAMICHKLSRIANGDPYYIESWRDINGYSELVVKRLKETKGATDSEVVNKTYNGEKWV